MWKSVLIIVVEAIAHNEFLVVVPGRFTASEMKVATAIATVVYTHMRVVCRFDAAILVNPFLVLLAIAPGNIKPLLTVSVLLVRKALGRILDTLDVAVLVVPFLIGITL